MERHSGRWIRVLVMFAAISIAALAAEPDVITDGQIAKLAQQFGPIAKSRLTGRRDLLVSPKYRTLSEHEKLTGVNDYMNRTLFVDDIKHWGKEDYWATPTEFLSTNAGDGEDFSIAKYITIVMAKKRA